MKGLAEICIILSLAEAPVNHQPGWHSSDLKQVVEIYGIKKYTIVHRMKEINKLCSPWVIDAVLTEEIRNEEQK